MKKKMKTKISQRTKNLGKLERSFLFDRSKVDEENRTIEIAFSSEEPVERWWGTEILGHAAENVRLGRMNDGGALLVDHDPRDHIGTIVKASIDSDRRGRAVVRFGRSARAEEVYQDVLDGIRKHISVGYRIHSMEEDRKTETFTANDWEPYEASLVSIPADASVGVGRNLRSESDSDIETKIISEERIMKLYDKEGNVIDQEGNIIERKAAPVAESAPAISQEERDALIKQDRKNELQRTAEIRALGKEHGQEEMADKAVLEGLSVDQMRVNVLDVLKESKPIETPAGQIGLTQKEVKRFSYCRALHALANPQNPRAQEAAAFEIECSNSVAQQRGVDSRGFFVPNMDNAGFVNRSADGVYVPGVSVPHEVQHRADLATTSGAVGGNLVATDLMSGSFIDVLRNSSALAGMGATIMSDLNGDIAIPAKLAAGASAWLATEGANAVQSDMTFRQVTMTPKTAATYTEFTRKLLLQSSLDVDNLIRNDISAGMALLLDAAGLYGTGANGQPTGIAVTSGIGDPTTWAAATPTWAEVVALESNVAGSNALNGSLGYLMETAMRGTLKTTAKDAGSGQFVMSDGGELNGYRGNVSNQVTSGDIFFGNFADLLIGMWGGMDLLIDPYTGGLAGTVRVVAHQSMDIAVRHAASFALGNDTA